MPKEIREDGESNKAENKLAQYIRRNKGKLHSETLIDGVLHSQLREQELREQELLDPEFTARCNRRCLLIAIVTTV